MFAPSGIVVTADGDVLVSDRSTSSGGSEVRAVVGPWPL
jgi:hypothetical protein